MRKALRLLLAALASLALVGVSHATAQMVPINPNDPWNLPPVAGCETVETLEPAGQLLDMVDWMTLDADLRATSHLQSEPAGTAGRPYAMWTTVGVDRITYLKTSEGDTWDVNLIDDTGIWAWRTESAWGTPRNYTQWRRMNQILAAPRFARAGYPGTRWINCDSAFAGRTACGAPVRYGHLGYVIHELYGPYHFDPGFGDAKGDLVKIAYLYACATTESSSCLAAEVSWFTRRLGWIAWRAYARTSAGEPWTLTAAPPAWVYVAPGTVPEVFPCDQEMP